MAAIHDGGTALTRIVTSGKCELCGKSFRKSGMARHLQSCIARRGTTGERGRADKSIHLFVEDDYRPEYWMHLAVPATAELLDLDQYFREMWLECCLHLSSFFIGRAEYKWQIFEMDDFFAAFTDREIGSMEVDLELVAPPRTKFSYWYDYGTTTELRLRTLGEVAGDGSGRIRLLARNDAPAIACSVCGAPATWVSPEEDDRIAMTAGLCDACAPGSEYRLPVLNSPRCGVCAYDGIPLQIVEDGDFN